MKVIKQQSVKQKVSLQDNKIPMVLSYEQIYTSICPKYILFLNSWLYNCQLLHSANAKIEIAFLLGIM